MLENSNAFLLATKRRRIAWERVLFVLLVGPAAYQCDRNRGLTAQLDADWATYQSSLQVPSLASLPISAVVVPAKGKPIWITTYALKPSGKPYHGCKTANGSSFDDGGWTVAVPPKYWKWIYEIQKDGTKGRIVTLSANGHTHEFRCTDKCQYTFDVTKRGICFFLDKPFKLGWPKSEVRKFDTKIRGRML